VLSGAGALQSLSRKGDCWDNAVDRKLLLHARISRGRRSTTWRYVSDGEPEIFTFIERYYNQTRLHSHNGYKSPNETEANLRFGALAA
jgi:putative transposase